MSDSTARPVSEEARFLRAYWHPETLGMYEKRWIAVAGSTVTHSDTNFAPLSDRTLSADPLYAFVLFGAL